MKEYNDYVAITRQYLKNYNRLKITIENLHEEIIAQRAMLQSESIAISRYNTETGGGASELNATEAAASRRIKIEQQINAMNKDKEEIERLLRKINRALEGLNNADKALVIGYYIDGYSWQQLGRKYNYTEKWARSHGNSAVKELTFMIFGSVAQPHQLRFVFAI